MKKVSIVIPVYNEVQCLKHAVEKIDDKMKKITKNYEIIIAEDGSTDGTKELAEKLSGGNIIYLHSDKRLGRGKGLTKAFNNCKGDIVVYMDVDLATDLNHLPKLIDSIEKGADFATGSRMIKGAICKRPLKREIASRGYNYLVRLLFRIPIYDMQCGFKAFKKESLFKVLPMVEDNHWFWDSEFMIRAYRMGFKIVELPVRWEENIKYGTKVKVSDDAKNMGAKLFKLWWRGNV